MNRVAIMRDANADLLKLREKLLAEIDELMDAQQHTAEMVASDIWAIESIDNYLERVGAA